MEQSVGFEDEAQVWCWRIEKVAVGCAAGVGLIDGEVDAACVKACTGGVTYAEDHVLVSAGCE